ncbi:MAG: hypothetical protein E6R13_02370 [Spirochaetes bacterium]|nr:MAG: hypothetical protein E6R13_02370 [Spirochaetota bacterium]
MENKEKLNITNDEESFESSLRRDNESKLGEVNSELKKLNNNVSELLDVTRDLTRETKKRLLEEEIRDEELRKDKIDRDREAELEDKNSYDKDTSKKTKSVEDSPIEGVDYKSLNYSGNILDSVLSRFMGPLRGVINSFWKAFSPGKIYVKLANYILSLLKIGSEKLFKSVLSEEVIESLGKSSLGKFFKSFVMPFLDKLGFLLIPGLGEVIDVASLLAPFWDHIRVFLYNITKNSPFLHKLVLFADNVITPLSDFFDDITKSVEDLFSKSWKKSLTDFLNALDDLFKMLKGFIAPFTGLKDTLMTKRGEAPPPVTALKPSPQYKQVIPNSELQKVELSGTGFSQISAISSEHESGGASYGAIGNTQGDFGGASYGKYQFSTNTGSLKGFLDYSNYSSDFAGMTPGSQEFNNQWEYLAKNDPKFRAAQENYAQQEYYIPAAKGIKSETGLDVSNRSVGLKSLVVSSAVQLHKLTPTIFKNALAGKDPNNMSDSEIIQAVNTYKEQNISSEFRKSSQAIQQEQAVRYRKENEEELSLAGVYQNSSSSSTLPITPQSQKSNVTNTSVTTNSAPSNSNVTNTSATLNSASTKSNVVTTNSAPSNSNVTNTSATLNSASTKSNVVTTNDMYYGTVANEFSVVPGSEKRVVGSGPVQYSQASPSSNINPANKLTDVSSVQNSKTQQESNSLLKNIASNTAPSASDGGFDNAPFDVDLVRQNMGLEG